jgi:hypothetical protein
MQKFVGFLDMQIWSGHQDCVEVAVSKSQAVRLILKPTLCNTVNFKCKLCIDSYEEHTSMSRQLIRFSQVIRFIATSWILNLEVLVSFLVYQMNPKCFVACRTGRIHCTKLNTVEHLDSVHSV